MAVAEADSGVVANENGGAFVRSRRTCRPLIFAPDGGDYFLSKAAGFAKKQLLKASRTGQASPVSDTPKVRHNVAKPNTQQPPRKPTVTSQQSPREPAAKTTSQVASHLL